MSAAARRRRRCRRRASACARSIAATGLCAGCLRTLDEIAAWSVLDDDAKRARAGARIAARARRTRRRAHPTGSPMASADWYFDFVSPFAYLQSEQLASLGAAGRASATGRCCSPGCSSAHGQKGPAEIAAQARVHLSLRRLAGEAARHPAQVAARASVQSAAAAAARDRLRLRARGRAPDLPFRLARRPAARPADRMGRARRASSACPTRDARIADAGRQGRASPQHRRGDRARRVRRADARDRRRAVLGRRRDRDGRRLHRGRAAASTDPEYERVAALPVGARAARRRAESPAKTSASEPRNGSGAYELVGAGNAERRA